MKYPVTEAQPIILPLTEIDKDSLRLVGGKGANLGEMTRAGLPVPPGFCVTTVAYEHVATEAHIELLIVKLEKTPADSIEPLALCASNIRNLTFDMSRRPARGGQLDGRVRRHFSSLH
jgi:phosphoenolpyruvate synthase/pyruvate phosphate dikinase